MTEETLDSIKVETLKDFNIGTYLAEGWRIFRRCFFSLLLLSLITGGLNVLTSGVLSWYWVIMFPIFLFPLLYAAYYGVANGRRMRDYMESDDFFVGVERISSLALTRFVQIALQFLLVIPIILLYKPVTFAIAMAIGVEVSENAVMIPGAVFLLALLYFSIAYIFTDQYVIFKGQNYWQAMTSSRQRVNKQWGRVFLLLVITSLLGLLITSLFFVAYLYFLYKNSFISDSFGTVLRNFTEYGFNPQALYSAFLLIICFTYPYTYCVLHAAFADIENLPTEEKLTEEH